MIDAQIVGYGFQSGCGGQRVGQGIIQSGDALRFVELAFLEYHDYHVFLVGHYIPTVGSRNGWHLHEQSFLLVPIRNGCFLFQSIAD